MVRSLCPLAASSYRAGKRAWRYFNAVRCFLQRDREQLNLVRFVCPFNLVQVRGSGEEFGRMNQMSDQIWTILEIWLKEEFCLNQRDFGATNTYVCLIWSEIFNLNKIPR